MYFISCDWGTSVLRLRVIEADSLVVTAALNNGPGISATFGAWKQSGQQENDRLSFYQVVLAGQIKKLEGQSSVSLKNLPVIISGMASSNMGMMELAYKELPFHADGRDLPVTMVGAGDMFEHPVLIVSGAKSTHDVMRGEETQLAGCLSGHVNEDELFIFPGTHSKHIRVKNGEAVGIQTFMTGEFFELLSEKSTLSNAIGRGTGLLGEGNKKKFEAGVTDSLGSNLLHLSFSIRVNYLLKKISKEENYWYLSGLLVGTELKELIRSSLPLTIVSDGLLMKLYCAAFQKLGTQHFRQQDAGEALIRGHVKIYHLNKAELERGPLL